MKACARIKSSTAGFTLVELMMIASLASFIALSLASFLSLVSKNNVAAQSVQSTLGAMTLIREVLSAEKQCIASLANTTITGPITATSEIPLKLNAAGLNIQADVANVFGSNSEKLKINSVLLKKIRIADVIGGGKSLIGQLEIDTTRVAGSSQTQKVYHLGSLMLSVDSTLKIIGCSALSSNRLEDTCVSIGAVWNEEDQTCRQKTPNCPAGALVYADASNTPSCLSFRTYLAQLCQPGEALKTNPQGDGVLCEK